ncbi:hypothetical protein Glove_164g23 [Diversispora epigaea]|uniref:Uncharacterized protein n=1 Tax=Diversispora epigaea TaxID=1348612 RepID=A0A397IU05_9GLOM|nr:hypothetical protein Glove_164g23 [Diversispora epigaea]
MISREQIEQLNRTIAKITEIYNQKIEEIINYAEEQRNNGAPTIIDPRKVQELHHIRVYVLPKSQIIWDLGRQNAQITSIWDLEFVISAKNTNYNLGFGIWDFGIWDFGIWISNLDGRRRYLYQEQQQPVRPSLNTLLSPRSPPLLAQIQRGNLFPEGSTFTQTRPSTRSNTPTSSDSPSRSISPIENTRHIQRDFLTGQNDSDFEIEYQPIINSPRNRNIEVEPEDQLLINLDGSDNNNNLGLEREEPNEEDQDIEAYNNENL